MKGIHIVTKFVWNATILITFAGILFAFGVWGPRSAKSQEKNPSKKEDGIQINLDQSKFMRQKLEASSQILEGLVTEDSELLVKGARSLVEMSSAEKWQVQHNVIYKQFSVEFQQAAQKLVDAAEKENFDGAALKWIDATLKCMECHRFVRTAQLARGKR